MALTNWNDILNKPKGIDEVPEIALTVEQLSASVLSISEDVGEIAGDVQEIALEISQLSASTLPYSSTQSTKQKIDELSEKAITSINKYSQITGGIVDRDNLVKVGNTIFGSARLYNIDVSSVGYFFEIPAGYRPKTNQHVMGYVVIDSDFIPIQVEVRSDGLVNISYSQSVNTTQVGFSGSWTTI